MVKNKGTKKVNNFQRACNKYLTQDEQKSLTYEQKIQIINYGAKQELSNYRYEKLTGVGDMDNKGKELKLVCDAINSLPMTERQRNIARYRYQQYTISEIGVLLGISERTIDNEIMAIKVIMGDNAELLESQHDTWHKKVTAYDE